MTQDEALNILKTGANVFLTGEPGSGKTHTINEYIRYLREHSIEPSVTASTGIAATHVGGMTIHAWSGIGIRRKITAYDLDELGTRESLVRRVRSARVLIIDEVSMLDAGVLDAVDTVMRALRRREEAFGGVQMIFVGDFFQLPPVVKHGEPPARFCFDAESWKNADPLMCYLTEQHRQEDEIYLGVLSAIRRGEFDEMHYEQLETRRVASHDEAGMITKLFAHNSDVDRINGEELAKLPGIVHVFPMTSGGRAGGVESLKRGCLSPETLELKEGAIVMFTKNHFEGRYVNGTLGEVIGFDPETTFPVVRTKSGERIVTSPAEWAIEDGGKVLARIQQIPLRLAWTITIHKSQGMSLESAAIDLSRAFEYGQGYVALSRVRSLEGLYLLGVNARAFEVHPEMIERDGGFRSASDSAIDAFNDMSKEKLDEMHKNFIIASGGKLHAVTPAHAREQKPKKLKVDPLKETLVLIGKMLSIADMAKEKGVTAETIMRHIERLRKSGVEVDISYMEKDIPKRTLKKIRDAFKKYAGTENEGKLTPVKELLGDAVSYEEIKLVRLLDKGMRDEI